MKLANTVLAILRQLKYKNIKLWQITKKRKYPANNFGIDYYFWILKWKKHDYVSTFYNDALGKYSDTRHHEASCLSRQML
jgi:hypothetical protein